MQIGGYVELACRRTAASLRDILHCMYNDSSQAEMQVYGGDCSEKK